MYLTPELSPQGCSIPRKGSRKPKPAGAVPESLLLLAYEVFEVTRLSPSTIYRHIRAGKFPPPVPTGSDHRRWRRADIERWLDGQWSRAGE